MKRKLYTWKVRKGCYASEQCQRLMGFHTHPHLCGGSWCFLTASVTSCWNSLDMALLDTQTCLCSVCVSMEGGSGKETGRKIERQNRGQWKNGSGICQTKRLRPLEDDCMEDAASLSFILTVNLNLEEVQRIPRLCFKTKAVTVTEIKLSLVVHGWNTRGKKTKANALNLPQ